MAKIDINIENDYFHYKVKYDGDKKRGGRKE